VLDQHDGYLGTAGEIEQLRRLCKPNMQIKINTKKDIKIRVRIEHKSL